MPEETSRTRIFPGWFSSLRDISDFVTQAAREAGLDERAIGAVQLAVDEACSNIIEHAYGGEGRGEIECTCHISAEGLTVVLRDKGRPFDPTQVPEPDPHPDLKRCAVGGLGLHFMRKMMDEVRFEFTPDMGNILTMVKRRSPHIG
ncbi:MAG: ATP-binding protein [Anaerolineae bacterium]|nr:ATP-binding protein [Anaerolineae bacterium]